MKSILIVDQDAENRRRVTTALRYWGYHAAEAVQGAEALSLLQSVNPDLLLIAAGLSDMSGFDLCQKIRAFPQAIARPVILLTPTNDDVTRVKGARVGVDGYLVSPVLLSELYERTLFYTRQAAGIEAGR